VNTLTGLDLALTQYQIDVLEFSAAFQAAVNLTKSLFTTHTADVTLKTTECLNANVSDPCCSTAVEWSGPQCAPRPQTAVINVFDAPTNELYDTCAAPSPSSSAAPTDRICTLNAVQDYSAFAAQDSLGACAKSGLIEEWIVRREMMPYRQCRDQFLGAGPFNQATTPCLVDSDCDVNGTSPGLVCDLVRKTCLISVKARFQSFFKCLITSLDPFVVFNLASLHNISVADNLQYTTDETLWTALYSGNNLGTLECVDPNDYIWASGYRYHWNLRPDTNTITCFYCDKPICFDELCTLSQECNVRFKTPCFQSWHSVDTDADGCTSEVVCNWNSGSVSSTATASASDLAVAKPACEQRGLNQTNAVQFCGVTDNGFDYQDLRIPQAQCDNATNSACVLANGSIVVAPRTTCGGAAYMTCDQPAFKTQAACTDPETGGHCSNDFIFFDKDGVVHNTVCVYPSNPWHLNECAGILSGERPVKDGCVSYTMNSAACATALGTVYTRPTSKTECDALGSQCRRPIREKEVENFFNDVMWTMQPQADCAEEGGSWLPKYQWVPARWVAASERTQLQWVNSTMAPRWVMTNDTISMSTLHSDLLDAVNAKIRFQRKSYTFCRFGRYPSTLAEIACACASTTGSVTSCFKEHPIAGALAKVGKVAAVTDVCGGASADITASPVSASFELNTLNLEGVCVPMQVLTLPGLTYKSNSKTSTATYFIDFSEKTDWSFRNKAGALVGQVVGDGVGVAFNATYVPGKVVKIVNPLRLCTSQRSDIIDIQQPGVFTVYDFARVNPDNKELTPLEVTVVVDDISGALCSTSVFENAAVYMPILRAPDYKTHPHKVFTQGEFITLIVVVICYGLTICFAAFKLSPLFIIRAFHFGVGVTIPIIFLYVVRLIYFALLLSGAISVNEANVGIFFLIELPIMLYFSTTLYFVVNWAFVTRTIKRLGPAKNLRPKIMRAFGISNLILYLIFIAFLLAFYFSVKPPYELCDGQVFITDNLTGKVISTVYRLFMGILALVLGVGFMVFGTQLYCSVKDAKFATDKFKRTIYMQASLCSVSLVAEALFLITIAFLPHYQNNIFSMAWMLVCEIAPGTAILYFLDIKALQKAADTTRTSASVKSAGGMKSLYDNPSTSAGEGSAATGTGNSTKSKGSSTEE